VQLWGEDKLPVEPEDTDQLKDAPEAGDVP
jgi:hypothetical protein